MADTTIFDPQFLVVIIPAVITGAAGILHALNQRKVADAAAATNSGTTTIPIISGGNPSKINTVNISQSIANIEQSIRNIETKVVSVETAVSNIRTELVYINKELTETQSDVKEHDRADAAEFRNMDRRISILEDNRGRNQNTRGLPHP